MLRRWTHPLKHFLELLNTYVQDLGRPSVKVWIDVMVYNQHDMHFRGENGAWNSKNAELNDVVVEGMRDTVASTKRTLFFLDPKVTVYANVSTFLSLILITVSEHLFQGDSVSRIWCLYELWQTVRDETKGPEQVEVRVFKASCSELR